MRSLALPALLALALATPAARAMEGLPSADVKGGTDHPVISRFTGSLLAGYGQQDWATTVLPGANGMSKTERNKFADPLQVEGKITRLFYVSPEGKTPLEVFRNQQQALTAAGFKPRFLCEAKDCLAPAYFAITGDERSKSMDWAKGYLVGVRGGGSWVGAHWGIPMSITWEEGHVLAGTLTRDGSTLQVLVFTSQAANEYTNRAASYIEIVEPKAMPTGHVTVDAKAIASGLQAEGRIALYGILFDTGKTELKPDSNAQLDQMVAVLKAQPAAKVFIVGHTDNAARWTPISS